MNSVPSTMTATVMAVTAIAVIPGVIATHALVLTLRASVGNGKNHAPKEKDNDADEPHQHNCEMHPPGRAHLISPLSPRPGRHCNSTMWM